tara:strand:- start:280 stop:732 length:453 start_codon:yes stop_codon:yes gene_type:complete
MHNILKHYNKINAFGQDQDMHYEVLEPGKIIYTMKIKEKHMGTTVAAHGGIIAAFMDAILGVTALSLSCESNKLVSTVEFKMNYFSPTRLGDELVAEGYIESAGKRIIITTGVIRAKNRDNVVIAKGMGTFNAYPIEKSGMLEKEDGSMS